MAKQDFLPPRDADFLTWFQNFKTQLTTLGAGLGVTAGEQTIVNNDLTEFTTKLNTLTTKKADVQGATQDKENSKFAIQGRLRPLVRRIKTQASYTAAQGEQLGIVGPEDTTDLSTSKPTLKAASVLPAAVAIGFNKSIASGVKILSKRGAETAFTFLAIDTNSPYLDNRASLAAGPETRQYQAQYLDGDDPVGLVSDTLTVTVPG
jgi:hypothetical protein